MPGEFDYDHTFLLVWISSGHNRDRHDVTPVDGEVRSSRWDVHEIARPHDCALQQAVAVPYLGFAADGVDRGLVLGMEVRHAAGTRRDHGQVQAQPLRAGGTAADAGGEAHALLAVVVLAGSDDDAVTVRAHVRAGWR